MDLNYRLPLDSVTHIRIDGDIEIHSVTQADAGSPVIIQPRNGDTSVAKVRFSLCLQVLYAITKDLKFDAQKEKESCSVWLRVRS